MRYALLFTASIVAAGCCTSDKCIAVTASNMMHDTGEAAAETIKIGCTERYAGAKTDAQIAELDKPCLPAGKAYTAFAKAQAHLEAVLSAVLAGAPSDAIKEALAAAKDAATTLAQQITEVPQ